jgi:hypothetical protein
MTTKINSFKLDERSDYKLTVKYKDKDYPLNFKSAAFDDCFESRLSEYKNAKAACRDSQTAENERVMIDLLNKKDDFLKVITLFLHSRIKLGRKEIAYNLSIRYTEDSFVSAGYSDDTRVYKVGKYQIWKQINTDQKV